MAQKKWYTYNDYQHTLAGVLEKTPPVVVVEGEEDYLRQCAIEKIKKSLLGIYPEAAVVEFYGPSVQGEGRFDFAELLTELTSASLFAAEKIVIFKNAQRTLFGSGMVDSGGRKGRSPLEQLAEYIANPEKSNYLIFETEKINRQRIIGKSLAKQIIIPCPVLSRQGDVMSWIRAEVRNHNKDLEGSAAEVLYRAHGSDLGVLASEIEKLTLYAKDQRAITVADVEMFLSGTVEFSIFELTNALERRDLSKALRFVRLICEQGSRDQSGKRQDGFSSAHQSLALISSMLENLLYARALLSRQFSVAEITSELGLYPKRAANIIAAAECFTLQELEYALEVMVREMKSSHDTGADPKLSLERIAVAICQKRPHYARLEDQ